ncbi:hypothetical protein NSK_004830 [Nannochloropsis salina CCMP1776]|uniref:Cyclin-like domain-containing protein n=1 Tax=Nannochloropsis salina CCMP1776 TaxID=1027361 RepID=A0A4D9CXJ9_9STRA|nr:hypothetical protein NSK_004830 [Nannochloropsis salina CCMP1776]|eukprot:TFJ83726.1 hypothetical protein NSK_004830 [Nannochloropsis salina CCMP1776]
MVQASPLVPTAPAQAEEAPATKEDVSLGELDGLEDVSVDGEWHEVVLLPRHVLRESPSRRLGVPEAVERRHRIFGCELIQEAGILLRQPQVVMATAQTLFHRFFYRRALTSERAQDVPEPGPGKSPRVFLFDAFTVAMGCVFLASKLEEKPRAPRDVLFVFHHMCRRRRGLGPSLLEVTSVRYHDLREALLMIEKYVLKELGFGFYSIMDHPHKFILYYIKTLDGTPTLAQRAWNYLNDSLRLDCCVRFRAELIACTALYMASRDLGVKLPDDPPWFALFGASLEEMRHVGNVILSLYREKDEEGEEAPLRWLEPLHQGSLVAMEVLRKVEGKEGKEGKGKGQGESTDSPGAMEVEGAEEGSEKHGGGGASKKGERGEEGKGFKGRRDVGEADGARGARSMEENGDGEGGEEGGLSIANTAKATDQVSGARLSRSPSAPFSPPSSSSSPRLRPASAAGGKKRSGLSSPRSNRPRRRSSSPASTSRSRSWGRDGRGRSEVQRQGHRRSRSRSRSQGKGRGRERSSGGEREYRGGSRHDKRHRRHRRDGGDKDGFHARRNREGQDLRARDWRNEPESKERRKYEDTNRERRRDRSRER